jgi:hypothetical protein
MAQRLLSPIPEKNGRVPLPQPLTFRCIGNLDDCHSSFLLALAVGPSSGKVQYPDGLRDDDYGDRLTTTTMAGWASLRLR